MAGNNKVATEDIESLFRQKPNRRIFTALPYLWLYNFGKRFHKPAKVQVKLENSDKKFAQLFKDNRNDIEKIQKLRKKKDRKIAKLKKRIEGNFIMRVMGEPPTFYDTLIGRKTAEEIGLFMQTKGFFDAKVDIKTKIKRKRIWVTYQISEGQPTYIADVDWIVPDSGVYKTIQKDIANSRIKVDNIYDENKLTDERTRIEKLLRDKGYFDFSRSYVAFDVDTNLVDSSGRGRKVAEVDIYISDPVNNTHKAYVLDKVYFHTISADQFATKRQKDTLVFYPKFAKRLAEQDTIHYIYEGKRLAYSPRVLYKKIRMFPKQLYSNTATIATQSGLLGLDMFKFVNISFDTTKRSFVANIFTSPLDKYQFSNEGGFNVAQGPPGPFVHFSLRNRNVFRGCELFENDFQFLFDGQTGFSSETGFYNSQEISFNSALIIPQLLIPTRLRFAFLNLNPRTRINIGFNFVRRPEYTRANIRSALVYTFQKNFHAFNLTPVDLSIVNTLN
ncbi:MAG TPA: hypothetical protein DCM08_07350, partial [Microscillaceae bacterium]|nr:hypothetical protein [Microscillaceae bacterium]